MLIKLLILVSVLFSSLSWGAELDQRLTVKERLRIALWTEGLAPKKPHQTHAIHQRLPEEIERSLRKL